MTARSAYELLFEPDGRDRGDLAALCEFAAQLVERLCQANRELPPGPELQATAEVVSDAAMFAMLMKELLDPKGSSEFKVKELRRRRKGKPTDRMAAARAGRKAAAIAERLIGEGWKVDSAVTEAGEQVKGLRPDGQPLSPAEVYSWLADQRRILVTMPAELADYYLNSDKSPNSQE